MSYNPTEYSRIQRHPLPFYGEIEAGDGAGSSDPTVVVETLDIANFNGDTTIPITSIGGVSLNGNFAIVYGRIVSLATSGAGTSPHVDLQLSTDGGSTWVSTSYDGIGYKDSPPVDFSGNAALEIGDINASTDTGFLLQHLNSAVPTVCYGYNFTTAEERRTTTWHPTAVQHTAFRLRLTATGAKTFTSGTLELVGYRIPQSKIDVQTITFSAEASKDITVPAGYTFGSLFFPGLSVSASGNLAVRLGTNGTFLSGASDYQSNNMALGFDNTVLTDHIYIANNLNQDKYGPCEFTNLNMAAPVNVLANIHQTGALSLHSGGTLVNGPTTARNSIRLFSAQSINFTGTVYAIFYKIRATVTAHVLPNDGTTDIDVLKTAMTKSPMITLSGLNFDLGNTATLELQVSNDDVTYATTGYYTNGIGESGMSINASASGLSVEKSLGTITKYFYSTMLGFNKDCYVLNSMTLGVCAGADSFIWNHGAYQTKQTNTAMRLVNTGNAGRYFNGETIYIAQYHWN